MIKSTVSALKSKQRLDDLNAKVASLEDEKRGLEADIEYKKTQEYIEEKARDDLNMVKPGEKVYVVEGAGTKLSDSVGAGNGSQDVLSATSSYTPEPPYKSTNWYLWYRLFF